MSLGNVGRDIIDSTGRQAIYYGRVSTKDQRDSGTSLQTQETAAMQKAAEIGAAISQEAVVSEDRTGKDLERPGLKRVFELAKTGRYRYLIVHTLDRLYRPETEADAWRIFPILRELQDLGLTVVWVHGGGPTSGPFSSVTTFLDSWKAGQEREAIRERTMRGKRRVAENGRVPSGFGRYGGPYGTCWDKAKKRLVWLSESHRSLVREVLDSYLDWASINSIVVELNNALGKGEGLPAAAGGHWHRSSVHRLLDHALLYAGTVTWSGIEIPEALERPVCREAEAEAISRMLVRNKELAKGFGRRKWLTGRVFGQCGRTYSLAAKQGCLCRGDSRLLPSRCGDTRIGLRRLETTVLRVLRDILVGNPDRLRVALIRAKAESDLEAYHAEEQQAALRRQLDELSKRRRLLSVQHENGVIDDSELITRFRSLKEERRRAEEALHDMTKAPDAVDSRPLTPWLDQAVPELLAEGVEQFAELERGLVQRDGTSMRVLDRVAEETGVRVTVQRTGALTIQFKVPSHLVPPGDSEKVLIEEPEQAMLSRTS